MAKAIVIGGGIAGCSTAYALAQRGVDVTLIERHEKLAQEGSGNPIAALYPKLTSQPSLANTLTLQGFEFTLNLLKILPDSAGLFNACGLLQLAFNAREYVRLTAQTQFQFLNQDEASEIAGIPLKNAALYIPQAGWLKPQALCEALCSTAPISIVTTTEALEIEKVAENWHVFNDKNLELEANIVVICTANDIKQFSQCQSAEITPVRGQINLFTQNKMSENIKAMICSNHYLSPAVAGWHVIGTSYAPNDMNPNISETDTRENLNALRAISPEIYQHIDLNSVQSRVAWRSQTLDYMPLAGQLINEEILRDNPPRYNANPADLPWLDGLYVNAGHGSKGMITTPICGELIASLATNSDLPIEPKLACRMNPSRFLLREFGAKLLANSLYK